jgi:hypothetical protein
MRPQATSAWDLKLLVYGDLSYQCMGASVWELKRHLEHRDEARDPPFENEQSSVHADVSQAGRDRCHLRLRHYLVALRPHTLVA